MQCWWRVLGLMMLSAKGLWAERDLYCATPAVTQILSFFSLLWMTTPFSRFLQPRKGLPRTSILTWILTSHHSVASKYGKQGMLRTYCNPDPIGSMSGVDWPLIMWPQKQKGPFIPKMYQCTKLDVHQANKFRGYYCIYTCITNPNSISVCIPAQSLMSRKHINRHNALQVIKFTTAPTI
jgi:hypothetical protein